ncbi:hypothetical protein ASE63_13410 [Bosea sp. Root381]|uniref:hypothetical protein n=1 Tax=Bosea sp. Root381 TaxID=1736524 RepID=UPI0007000973|nr:hypothetical protein [Bosea sp. Root381]KRE17444.1 hypothetical protein ASE63_13410 [Bosea sp. Root381]
MAAEPDQPERIDSTFRSGSLTAVGIILGFSLTFLSRWAANPNEWSRIDIVPLALLGTGIGIQLKAFSNLMSRHSLLASHYDRTRRLFMIGLVVLTLGIAAALVNDVLGLSRQNMFG